MRSIPLADLVAGIEQILQSEGAQPLSSYTPATEPYDKLGAAIHRYKLSADLDLILSEDLQTGNWLTCDLIGNYDAPDYELAVIWMRAIAQTVEPVLYEPPCA